MIEVIHSWRCTLCNYGKTYSPKKEKPPNICPACDNGLKYTSARFIRTEGE